MVVPVENEELPKENVKRVVKAKLAELARDQFDQEKNIHVQKEANLAFATSTRIFVHFLAAAANDVCRKEGNRQTINTDDVMKALETVVEFPEFVGPINEALEGFRKDNELKKSLAKANKRKALPKDSGKGKQRNGGDASAGKSNHEDPVDAIDDLEEDDSMQG